MSSKVLWRREWVPTPVFCPGEFHGLYSPWGCKESDTTEWLSLSHLSLIAQHVKNPSAIQEPQEMKIWSLGQKYTLEEEMQPTPVFLPRKSHGERSLVGYSPSVANSHTRLNNRISYTKWWGWQLPKSNSGWFYFTFSIYIMMPL